MNLNWCAEYQNMNFLLLLLPLFSSYQIDTMESNSDNTEKLLENLTLDSLPKGAVSTSALESKSQVSPYFIISYKISARKLCVTQFNFQQKIFNLQDVQSTAGIRHCAFCLEVCELPVKKCGGCKKRAYCSKDCQLADWKVNGTGQGHKNWCCRYVHGEEDIDWEVLPVLKGLGIVAKKLIPAGFRIIVEHIYTDPHAHPGCFTFKYLGYLIFNKKS